MASSDWTREPLLEKPKVPHVVTGPDSESGLIRVPLMGTKQPLKGIHWELLGRQWEEWLLVLGIYNILGTISVILGKAIRNPFPCGSCGPLSWSASGS